MPCMDYGPIYTDEHHQTLTRLACDRCREIEARGGKVPSFAKKWWDEHKQRDEELLKSSKKAIISSKIRAKAVKKLTPEEREELGL